MIIGKYYDSCPHCEGVKWKTSKVCKKCYKKHHKIKHKVEEI